jgi:hypothetical protein
VGTVACFLFAGLSYRRLVVNHHAHHTDPTGPDDPDFSTRTQSFWPWFATFMRRYTTWPQILVMAAKFNLLLLLGVAQWRILVFWVVPAMLGTVQLFYFGTFVPAPCRPTTCGPCSPASSSATTGSTTSRPPPPGGGCGGCVTPGPAPRHSPPGRNRPPAD